MLRTGIAHGKKFPNPAKKITQLTRMKKIVLLVFLTGTETNRNLTDDVS
jgi:hypothetical protein